MVDPRFALRGGIALAAAGTVLSTANTASATHPDVLVNDFGVAEYPGENQLGEWANHVGFADAGVAGGVLRLEYDDGGFFATNVYQDVSAYSHLALVMRGDAGGEEDDVQLTIGNVQDTLANLTSDSIGTSFSTIRVDLQAVGVDRSSVDTVRLSFWEGASGAVEIDSIALVGEHVEEVDLTPATTLAEFCPDYRELYLDRILVQHLPGETGGGHGDYDQTAMTDEEKADLFDVDVDAIREGASDGSLTFAEMGTQAIDHASAYERVGFPRHATCKLLPRLMLLPHETEALSYHNPTDTVWDETAGPVAATNDPPRLVQDPWPTDAHTYVEEEVAERDRVHDQPEHEDFEGWNTSGELDDDVLYDETNPILDAVDEKVNPATGDPLGGDGFTASAPIEVEARIHVESNGYWYQVLNFTNTSDVPFHLDGAVTWWVGPSAYGQSLSNGYYNNEQRPNSGLGHPQRDVVEVVYDESRDLSAWAIRLAFHDEPYNMRTAYPNQRWGFEIGVPASPAHGSAEARQSVVDTMVNTCHVEIETDMDRNDDLLDALNLRNRVTN